MNLQTKEAECREPTVPMRRAAAVLEQAPARHVQ